MLLNELAIGARVGDTRSSAVTEGLVPALAIAFKRVAALAIGLAFSLTPNLAFNLAFDSFVLIR